MKTLLDAARKADPKSQWRIGTNKPPGGKREICVVNDKGFIFDINNKAWRSDLQEALERDGWEFWYRKETETFVAWKLFLDDRVIQAPTKPELLLAIVRQGGGE